MEKSEQQEPEEANHVLPTVKKPSDGRMLLLDSCLLSRGSQPGRGAAYGEQVFSCRFTRLRQPTSVPRHPERTISQEILELTANVNYHTI